MNGFVAGPWIVWNDCVFAGPVKKVKGGISGYRAEICRMDDMDLTNAQVQANARLIAAAPEMHEEIETAGVDLDLLLMAIKAGDPSRELEIRASDIKRRLSAALSRMKG
jgi:hypothetical protein